MRRHAIPRGLRVRLTVLVAGTVVVALGVAFLTTYNGTGTQVRKQIDSDLRQETQSFENAAIDPSNPSPTAIWSSVSAYVLAQNPFTVGGARVYVVRIPGKVGEKGTVPPADRRVGAVPPTGISRVGKYTIVTNEPNLLNLTETTPKEHKRRARDAQKLLEARPGFSNLRLSDRQQIRMLVTTIRSGRRVEAIVGIAEPLGPVSRAKSSVARTFVLTGLIVAAIAFGIGWLVASGISRPLRRMARTVTVVDAGELSHRIGSHGPRDEVRMLAEAFDRMLDRLEDAFARQRSFVSDASHELRTPLTVIRGQLEVLARQPDVTQQDVSRVERTVLTEILRMERLVEDLLLLARADEGELVRMEPLDVDPFFTELFDGLTLTAARRFELSTLPGGVISADPDRIAQVVRNLVRNAVEHTRGEDGLVRLVVMPHGADRLEVAVEDDGPGIPAEQRDRIFDRFQRTDSARARAGGGAGLGLAIARAIVEAHGGRIYAGESTAGGARVAFELPGYVRRRAGRPGLAPVRTG